MTTNELQPIADAVLRRAKQQGYVLPNEVRETLAEAGKPETLWREVVAAAGEGLRLRGGRYYPALGVSPRVRREQNQQARVLRAVRGLVRAYRSADNPEERREKARLDFVQVVKVYTDDGREHTLLTRDISSTGIRLVGTRRLLGQKVRLVVPEPGVPPVVPAPGGWSFVVRILWTLAIGEDLFENGGSFLEVAESHEAEA